MTTANNQIRLGNANVSSLYFGTANNLAVTTDSIPNMYYDYATGQIMRSTVLANNSANNWNLTGNAGTSAGLNFIGTTDLQPLMFKVNSVESGFIDYDPNKANTFLGFQTGLNNTGLYNTALGYVALSSNTTGNSNTAIGNIALRDNTTGNDNTAIGDETLTFNTLGRSNTAIGKRALFSNTVGNYNTASGFETLYNNTTGSYNTASGIKSLYTNTSGDNNSAYGFASLNFNTTGNYNTAIGQQTLYQNTTGSQNTALGLSALYTNTTGSNNTAIGISALLNTAASGNTALGDNAGNNSINNGNNNTFIGYNATANASGFTNTTALGYGAMTTASNQVRIGNANVNALYFGTANNLATTTDASNMYYDNATGQIMRSIASGNGSTHAIGDSYGGGIVFYVYDNGQHGLIAANTDQSTGVQWSNGNGAALHYTGSTGDGLLAGKMNTALIVATQMGDNFSGNFAAKVCADYAVALTFEGDWYLPSKYELSLLYSGKSVLSGFSNDNYWSATESDNANAWLQHFGTGTQSNSGKNNASPRVRAIRSF